MAQLWPQNLEEHRPIHDPLLSTMDHRREVIEISSDEEIEDENSTSIKPIIVGRQTYMSRSTVTHHQDLDTSDVEEVSYSHGNWPARSTKRRKLEQSESPNARPKMEVEQSHDLSKGKDREFSPYTFAGASFTPLQLNFEEFDTFDKFLAAPGPIFDFDTSTLEPSNGPSNDSVTKDVMANVDTSNDNLPDPAEQPPYYFDALLGVKMYRGPGFDKFPIAYGTVPEHEEICDRWDRDQALGLNSSFKSHDGSATDREIGDHLAQAASRIEEECVQSILEVLPDADHGFLLQQIRGRTQDCKFTDEEMQILPDLSEIVASILDRKDYPKAVSATTQTIKVEDLTGERVPWVRDQFANNPIALMEAVKILANIFDHTPTHYINKVVLENKSPYDSYLHLHDIDVNYHSLALRPYRRARHARVDLEKKYISRHSGNDPQRLRGVVNEIQAAKQHIAQEKRRAEEQQEKEMAEQTNLAQHKAVGEIVECGCCFDEEIALNRAVPCNNEPPHWFCLSCVAHLAENQVGLMKYEMNCMDTGDCTSTLSNSGLRQAVPPKLLDKLAFYQQQAEIAAAGIEGLEQCEFCDFKAISDSVDEDPVFRCQNPECRRHTCRRCRAEAHIPKSCDEVRIDRGLLARHLVEEARSDAMMRPCPKCKVKIIKESGCNKMQCTSCGGKLCYVCKADISGEKENGYWHFNRKGATCSLYEKGEVRTHDLDADEAEKEAIKKVCAENSELNEKELQIETGKVKVKSSVPTPPRGPVHRFMAVRRQVEYPGGAARLPVHLHHQHHQPLPWTVRPVGEPTPVNAPAHARQAQPDIAERNLQDEMATLARIQKNREETDRRLRLRREMLSQRAREAEEAAVRPPVDAPTPTYVPDLRCDFFDPLEVRMRTYQPQIAAPSALPLPTVAGLPALNYAQPTPGMSRAGMVGQQIPEIDPIQTRTRWLPEWSMHAQEQQQQYQYQYQYQPQGTLFPGRNPLHPFPYHGIGHG